MNQLKVSIVTISFNQMIYLKRAVESVLSQAYENLEYVVVDAGSSDGSVDYLRSKEKDLHRLIVEPDEGPPDGLNKGFKATTGDILYFLNADDLLLPGAVERAVDRFDLRPRMDVLMGDGVVIDENARVLKKATSVYLGRSAYGQGLGVSLQQGLFFRRSAFIGAGGFNVKNKSCWDAELIMDMAANGSRVKCDHWPYGAFRIHGQSITGSGRMALLHAAERKMLAEKHGATSRSAHLWNLLCPMGRCLVGGYGRARGMLTRTVQTGSSISLVG